MTLWLIRSEVGGQIAEARQSLQASAAELDAYAAQSNAAPVVAGSRITTRSGGTAQIAVRGTLTKAPDFWAKLFGGGNTTYRELVGALATAAADSGVTDVVLEIDSPGGTVDGLFEALAAVRDFRDQSGKRLSVRAEQATSAAYAIAAMAGEIRATSPTSSFGSIGVAVSYIKGSRMGSITNTDSPDKRPDLDTDEGRQKVRAYLDQISEQFVQAIASGRGTDVETVLKDYGRGAVFIAGEAKKRNMIDATPGPVLLRAVSSVAPQKERTTMDLEQLRAQHPGLYAQAVLAGVTQERDRVQAHLHLGTQSGAMEIACKAIDDGSELTSKLQAEYLAYGMNASDKRVRQSESDAAAAAVDGVAPSADVDMGDLIADIVAPEVA